MNMLDISGQRFGKLVAIKIAEIKNKRTYWECRCDCGNITIVYLGHLRRGATKSCGCEKWKTHGMYNTKTYNTWETMIQRCTNEKNTNYYKYGGRGITVCKEWKDSFENFLNDMGERPEGTTLDRKNNNKGYCKDNCQWSTIKEQANNTRKNTLITYNGKTLTLSQWEEETGIKQNSLWMRIFRLKWSVSDALTIPIRDRRKNVKQT